MLGLLDFDMKIIGVALKYKNEIYWLSKPNRHHHLFEFYKGFNQNLVTQGFMTDTGVFLNREEAYALASKTMKLNPDYTELFSEDLW